MIRAILVVILSALFAGILSYTLFAASSFFWAEPLCQSTGHGSFSPAAPFPWERKKPYNNENRCAYTDSTGSHSIPISQLTTFYDLRLWVLDPSLTFVFTTYLMARLIFWIIDRNQALEENSL